MVPILLLLLYGLVSFGVILAAKHTVTQAAADGARAAVPIPLSATPDPSTVAVSQADNTLGWLGKCGAGGVTCTTSVAPCGGAVSGSQCLTISVTYDYGNHPLIPLLPGLGLVVPSSLKASTTTLLAGPTS